MKSKYGKSILIFLIILGLLAASCIIYKRYLTEKANNTVEIVMDYNELLELSNLEGLSFKDVLAQFHIAGVNSLAIYDTNLNDLSKQGFISLITGEGLLKNIFLFPFNNQFLLKLKANNLFDENYLYIVNNNFFEFGKLKKYLQNRWGEKRVIELSVNNYKFLCIKDAFENIEKEPIGMFSYQLNTILNSDYNVLIRPQNFVGVNKHKIQDEFSILKNIPREKLSGVMFAGKEVLGYKKYIDESVKFLKERNLPIYACENPIQLQFIKQEGLPDFIKLNEYNAVRVYTIAEVEQEKLDIDNMSHRFGIAISERNIRAALIRCIKYPKEGATHLKTNLNYISSIKKEFNERGLLIGKAGTFYKFYPRKELLFLGCLGSIAAGMLLMRRFITLSIRRQLLIIFLFWIIGCSLYLKLNFLLFLQICALVAAISFPVVAVYTQLEKWDNLENKTYSLGKFLFRSMFSLIGISCISLCGAVFISSILGDVRFLLEMEIYKGVKFTFIMPIILILILYLNKYNIFNEEKTLSEEGQIFQNLQKILNYPLYMKDAFIGFIILIGLWEFIGRSGHTLGVPVTYLEMKIRYFLDNIMYVRPRFKEVLIGHPAFFMMIYAIKRNWRRKFKCLLVLLVMIGQLSLVETFCHLRSPIFLSLFRAINGWLLSIPIGIIVVLLFILLEKIFKMSMRIDDV